MSDSSTGPTDVKAAPRLSEAAEERRKLARRKFLLGSAAGSGMFVTTLFHQRADAATRHSGTYAVSAVATCTSIGGQIKLNAGGQPDLVNASVGSPSVKRYQCIVP